MFDVGFSELMMIAVVALVVIGPERLPKVARTLGHLFGRLQRYVNDVKADINREIELDELKKFKDEFEHAAASVESSVRNEFAAAESAVGAIAREAESVDSAANVDPLAEMAAAAQQSTAASAPAEPGIAAPAGQPAAVEHKTAA